MKVNLRNTRILWYVSLFNPCLYIVCVLFLPANILGLNIYPVLLIEFFAFFVLSLVYLIMILSYFRESTAVIVAYTMFTGVLVIAIIDTVFPKLLNSSYSVWLSTLVEVVGLLVAFRSFTVKARAISSSFKLFGLGMALITIPKFMVMLIATSFNPDIIEVINDLGMFVMLVALCLILNKTINYLKSGATPEDEMLVDEEE